MKKNIIKLLLAITITLTAFAAISTKIEDEDVIEETQLTNECETETIEEEKEETAETSETAEQLKVESKTLKVYTTTETTEKVIEQLELLPEEISKKLAGWTIYADNKKLYEIADENGEYNGTPIEYLGGISFKQSKVIFLNEEYVDTSLLHEIGHAINSEYGFLSDTEEFKNIYESEKYNFDCYVGDGDEEHCIKNTSEYFAEAFHQYLLAADLLKEDCPATYNYIDSFLNNLHQ